MTIFKSPFDDVPLRDQSITERVFSGLENRLDEIILIDGISNKSLRAREFINQVKRLAGGLQAAGFGHGKTVAIMSPNMPEFCLVFHAVAWAGGTITTLNPSYTSNEVKSQLLDSQSAILIASPEFRETAEEAIDDIPLVIFDTPKFKALFAEPIDSQIPVDLDKHTVVLPYSSGTTGLPKGVMLSHRNLVVNLDQAIVGTAFEIGETCAAFLPFFHIYGMNVIMNMHLAHGTLITMPRFDLELFLRISQDNKTRRMWTVPPVALALAKHPIVDEFDLSSLELVMIGAAPAGPELCDLISQRLNCETLQGYGMTELSPVAHVMKPNDKPRSGSAGLTAPNTLCRIVDIETGANQPAGVEGELWIKGPQVMQGYLNRPDATAETIVEDGWLRTGDIGMIDDDGYMFIVDRLKELIKYKGFQVAPAELEATLIGMDGIDDAGIIGLPDDEAGEIPIAFIVKGKNPPSEENIHRHFKKVLATYKQLHQIHWVDSLPKSASGKLLRRVLRDQFNNDVKS